MPHEGFFEGVHHLWDIWSIRGFMLLSLSMQLVLALAAPLRKKTSHIFIKMIVWSAYFLADWTAIFSFGLISNAGCHKEHQGDMMVDGDLLPLWASFLLIHLGGPDTITAFALEDNALWLRHLFGLTAQVFVFLSIFIKTLPHHEYMAPVVLVFAAGFIKYGERTRAMYLASLKNFRDTSLESLNQDRDNKSKSDGQAMEAPPVMHIHNVNRFFMNFKGLIVNITPNQLQLDESRKFFWGSKEDETFRMIADELNLLYEVFYTKILAVQSSWGIYLRILASYMSVAAVALFLNKKEGLKPIDVYITCALFAGGMALDTILEVMLASSNWRSNKKVLLKHVLGRCIIPFLITVLMYRILIKLLSICGYKNIVERSWSREMCSFNLLSCSFREGNLQKICASDKCCHNILSFIKDKTGIRLIKLTEEIVKFRHTKKTSIDNGIWEKTFSVLHRIAYGEPQKIRELYEARGELALSDVELKKYVTEFEYYQTILFWHIATEICYNTDDTSPNDNGEYKRFSRILSNYMMYLMVKRPDMMSPVADKFHQMYQGTYGLLKRLVEEKKDGEINLKDFCSMVHNHYGGGSEPLHEDKLGSDLINSCHLVTTLRQREGKWEVLFKVWVEMLSYAAGHCKVDSHARVVSEGGEYITFIWLWMAHLGIGPHFPKYTPDISISINEDPDQTTTIRIR